MKSKSGIAVAGLMVVALPLFVAVGCAGNKQNVAKTEITQDEAVQTAIATMDGYMAQLDRQQDGTTVNEATIAVAEPGQMNAMILQVADELSDEEQLLQETVDVMAAEQNVQLDEEIVLPPPQRRVFYFDSNSDEPTSADNEALLQHAQYLQQHPNVVLVISGHADSRGSKTHNQRLSELRAQNVAAILLAAGVSGAQLRIDGVGDNVPMVDPQHWQENRRVEFTYQDSMVANNQ